MSSERSGELDELKAQLAALTHRVMQLEAAAASEAASSPEPKREAAPEATGEPAEPAEPTEAPFQRAEFPQLEVEVPAPAPARPPSGGPSTWSANMWIAAVGAGLFLLGAIYFLYWSIEQGLLGPSMRVAIGCASAVAGGWFSLYTMRTRSVQLGSAFFVAALGTWTFSLYYGAMVVEVLPVLLGFGGTVFAVLVSGVLAAHKNESGLMTLGYALGLAAPVIFSTGSGDYPALTAYLVALMAFASVIFYQHPGAAEWKRLRYLAVLGTWALLLVSCADATSAQRSFLLMEVGLAYAACALWTWTPRGRARPASTTGIWMATVLGSSAATLILWEGMRWQKESFGLVLIAQAIVSLLLIAPVRRRMGDHSGDLGLSALALLHAFVAVPVVWDEHWTATVWAIAFAVLGVAAMRAKQSEHPDTGTLIRIAAMAGILASFAWAVSQVERGNSAMLVGNDAFLSGVAVAAGWTTLAIASPKSGATALILGELIFHLTFGREVYELARATGSSQRASAIAPTVLFAISGAMQWLMSVRIPKTFAPLAPFGYALLGISALKLLLSDLAGVGTITRALATLGVASVFLVAAFVGSRGAKGDGSDSGSGSEG